MYLIQLFLIVIITLYIYIFVYKSKITENFDDQTKVPTPAPAGLSWNFTSPKSAIKNYNETSIVRQNLNTLQANSSGMVGLNQPLPDWIYPYTYLNREFDQILLAITIKMEKDYNNNHMLAYTNNIEWQRQYPYQLTTWKLTDNLIKYFILDVMREINRRFNTSPHMVGFRRDLIKYYWISHSEIIITLSVYKKYTACDIKYADDIDPGINANLKMDFEREMIVYLDHITDRHRYHLKYLRFPKIDYKTGIEDIPYVGQFDTYFYLGWSKLPYYHLPTNTEVRSDYIKIVDAKNGDPRFKCFGQKSFGQQRLNRTQNQTECELAHGIWDKKCEKDTDCPYYQANKNYPNEFGGCNKKTGFCTWPMGVKGFSYRLPYNPDDAMCYNCAHGIIGGGTIGKCCAKQKDKRLYLNLESPDYAFHTDIAKRFRYRTLFDKYKLNWSKYI
jgi:hypothetical protein